MIRENIIKSINETLKELPHKAYIWKKDFPQVITIDEITSTLIPQHYYKLNFLST